MHGEGRMLRCGVCGSPHATVWGVWESGCEGLSEHYVGSGEHGDKQSRCHRAPVLVAATEGKQSRRCRAPILGEAACRALWNMVREEREPPPSRASEPKG